MPENTQELEPQKSAPQNPQPQEGASPQENPFDTSSEDAELKGILQEIEQLETALEDNGAQYLSENCTQEEQELFFDNPKEFFKIMLEKINVYFQEQIGSRRGKAQELEKSIAQKRQYAAFDQAEKDFIKEHPDVSLEDLQRFVNEELPPKIAREINQLPPLEALQAAYAQMRKQGKEEKLPKQLTGAPAKAQSVQGESEGESYFDRI